jgi:DNA processing protein
MPNFSPESAVRGLAYDEAAYPARLRDLRDAPTRLYARGTLLTAEPPAVAIVGARLASPYGLRVTRAIATTCARAGVCVVSGLARGIDAEAHRAALAAGGRTVAVLGTGPDVYYPRGHRTLQETIAREGLLLSEHAPGETGHRGAFPRRNRLIAALADITVVVEAGEESGALITSKHATELGRTVACVPNAIDVPTARGSNALLKEGAEPILAPDDVLTLLAMQPMPAHGPVLDGDAARCWDALGQGADDVRAIAQRTGLPLRQVTALLAMLEIDGLVLFDAAGRVRPAVGLG